MNPVFNPLSAALPKPPEAPEKLNAAAKNFEAIFVRQMLAEARKTSFGGDQLLGGQAMNTFRQMQDERFADIAAERGAFGLAKIIEAQLAAQAGAGVAPGASTSSARAGFGFEQRIPEKLELAVKKFVPTDLSTNPTQHDPGTNPAQPELVEGRTPPLVSGGST